MGEVKIVITPDAEDDIREIYDSEEQVDILRVHHSARPPEFE